MAALTEARDTIRRDGTLTPFGIKKNKTVYQGALVEFASGYVQPAVKAANKVIAGVAEEGGAVGNTANDSDGDVVINVRRKGDFKFANASGAGAIGAGDVGAKAYIEDDQTVTKTEAGSSLVGKITGVDSDGVWVEIG